MGKAVFISLVLVLSLFSVSAADVPVASVAAEPEWIEKDLSTEEYVYSVGYANMSRPENSKKVAEAKARSKLAMQAGVIVEEIIRSYEDENGNEYTERIRKEMASAVLEDPENVDEYTDEDGGVYVLMRIRRDNIKAAFDEILEDIG